jgi:hypothetical protein
MTAKFTNVWTRVLLAGLIVCASAGTLYGLAKLVERHGPKVVAVLAPRLPVIIFEQAFGLAAILIFWAFLLSPVIIWIGRWNKGGE